MNRRFKVLEAQHHRRFGGMITVDDLRKQFRIPDHADITIRVPGGGDWSNKDLDLEDTAISVSWEEVK